METLTGNGLTLYLIIVKNLSERHFINNNANYDTRTLLAVWQSRIFRNVIRNVLRFKSDKISSFRLPRNLVR